MTDAVRVLVVGGMIVSALYLPVLLVCYWFTHVRRQASADRQVIRTKEMAFFFMRALDEQWKLWLHLLTSVLPSSVMALGAGMAGVSLMTLLRTDVPSELFGIPVEAIEAYMRPVFFGFLGASLFMLQSTLRRYLDDDLGMDTHIVITVRVLMALIVSFVAGFLLPSQREGTALGAMFVYGAAFVFGVMPERGLETLYRIVVGWLGELFRKEEEDSGEDLQKWLSFDRVRLARLHVENVKSIDDLAYVEIERLAQKTRFDLQTIFHWVDRAVFCSQLRDSTTRPVLEQNGVRTFTAFETMYRDSDAREGIRTQIAAACQVPRSSPAAGSASSVAIACELNLDVAYSTMLQVPNTMLVRLYQSYKSMQVTGSFEAANRAAAYEEMGEYQLAVSEYGVALERNPLDPTLLTRRGRARTMYAQQVMRKGDMARGQEAFESALHDYDRALGFLPSWWEARMQRAITVLGQVPYLSDPVMIRNHVARAIDDLQQARKHNAEELEIVNWLGWAQLAQGANQEAAELLLGALGSGGYQAPAHVRATSELIVARALLEQARRGAEDSRGTLLEQARKHIVQAQGLMPRSSLLFLTQALYCHLESPGSRQEERFLELALQPGDVRPVSPEPAAPTPSLRIHMGIDQQDEIYELWGMLRRDRGDVRGAISGLSQAAAMNPARTTVYLRRGELYERLGDHDAAMADYTYLIDALGCDTAVVRLARAQAASMASVRRPSYGVQAERDIERALALWPERPEPMVAWGDWMRLRGEHREAVQAYDRASELSTGLGQRDGTSLGSVEMDLNVGSALAYCGLCSPERARLALLQAERLLGRGRGRPTRLQVGWGVFHTLNAADAEAVVQACDTFVHVGGQRDWSALVAADLMHMDSAVAVLLPGGQSLGRIPRIMLQIARIRVAVLLGAAEALDLLSALWGEVDMLSDEAQRASLKALLSGLDELGWLLEETGVP